MGKEKLSFCSECRKECQYEIKKVWRNYTIREKEYEMEVTAAFCKECGEEINIHGIMDLRMKEIDEQYRKIEDIVSIHDIEDLMEMYNIGKAPLSLALGFGEITITRYLQGQIPSKEYSDVIKKALESPAYMIEMLRINKEKIGETAYKKAMKAVLNLNDIINIPDKLLSVISYIFERANEVTPLALQKLLYYIQAIYMVSFQKPMYEEDCFAWMHGPVYEGVYNAFKTFKY
ncbi:type II toxin-antitoxin system antitoxin SocA domain-containing protein, partial [Floccifex sp.]|uniref:type II toxin-antitoxin system antitoxin SocA domain-containing protein n=1 Tax=Floccifex sp. TaxID=2815810 RepID=UPI002A75D4E9